MVDAVINRCIRNFDDDEGGFVTRNLNNTIDWIVRPNINFPYGFGNLRESCLNAFI